MPTIGEWCTRWMEDVVRPHRSPNTYRTYEARIRCGIIPAIGRIRVDGIRPSHARLLEKKETERNSGATARLTQTVLTLALDDAVCEGLINRNPLYRMDRPALDPREIIPLDPHDACRLIRLEPDPSWRLLWRLMFVTGMRLGEATGITPSEIIESEGRTCVLVERQLKTFPRVTSKEDMPRGVDARHMGGDKWLTRPKTRNGRRLVPPSPRTWPPTSRRGPPVASPTS